MGWRFRNRRRLARRSWGTETLRLLLHAALRRGGKTLENLVDVVVRFGARRLRHQSDRVPVEEFALIEVHLRMIGNQRFGRALRSEAVLMENWGQHELGSGVLDAGELDLRPLLRRFGGLSGMADRQKLGLA